MEEKTTLDISGESNVDPEKAAGSAPYRRKKSDSPDALDLESEAPVEKPEKMIKVMTIEEIEKVWPTLNDQEREEILLYQNLPLSFIKAYQSEINFSVLSLGISITEEVIDTFPSRISWVNMCLNGKPLQNRILAKYVNKIQWSLLLTHQQLDIEFLIRASEHMRKAKYNNRKDFWRAVSRYQDINEVYIKTYQRLLDFKAMSSNPFLTAEIIEKYLHRLDIELLLKTHTLPKELLLKYRSMFKPYLDRL